MAKSSRAHPALFWGVITGVVVLDVVTKYLAVNHLALRVPNPVMGMDWLRLTLVYNRGAAFGIHLGHDLFTRIVFISLTFVALYILWKLYTESHTGERMRVLACSLVIAGAIGNLIDRVRSSQGVVDFLDVGIGFSRWPTFNVADMGVTSGAVLLAVVLWRTEEPAPEDADALPG